MEGYQGLSWACQDDQTKREAASFLLSQIEDRIGKGEFSQTVATYLSKHHASLAVPGYIEQAVLWTCERKRI
jgi:hypothetical protein